MTTNALTFDNTIFEIIDFSGRCWLRGYQIGSALGYSQPDSAIAKIYDRNADEFTDQMTTLIELDTSGGKQKTRIFSLRGAHLIAMLARTPIAKAFRKWVLDVLDKETSQHSTPTQDPHWQIADLINELAANGIATKRALYNRLYRRFSVNSYKDIPLAQCQLAIDYLNRMANSHKQPNPMTLHDGEHYFVVKDGIVIWEKVLKPHCNDIPSNTLQNPKLMLEHIRQVVGEFVGKDALPAPKPILDINYPAITARPHNSFLPNQHWYKASDFVSGNFDPVKDFLDKLEQAGYEVTGLKIINNAKTWIIQQQDKAIKHIERGHRHITEGLKLYNDYGMCVNGFTMGKVSY